MVSPVWRQTLLTASPLLFSQLCLFLQQGNIVMPGIPLFLSSWFFYVPLMHLSWHFVSSRLMYRGESTTANLEGLKEGLPHGRREGCNKVLLFLLFCSVFRDYYAISCCLLCLLLGHVCPCQNMLFFFFLSVLFVQIIHPSSTYNILSILSGLPASLFWRGRGGRGEDGANQRRASEQFCEERNNDKYNMMLPWSDQDH